MTTTTINNRMEQINLLLEPEGISVHWTEKFKNNGMREGLVIHSEEKNCTPILYMNENSWQKSNEDIVKMVKEIYEEQSFHVNADVLLNREFILSKVLPRVFSETNIPPMQKDYILFEHRLDLAFAFYVPLDEDEKGAASITLTEPILKQYGIHRDEVFLAAERNMEIESKIQDMFLMLQEMGFVSDDEEVSLKPLMLIATNQSRINGAGILFCKNALLQVCEQLGQQYAILPSSVHECICVPYESEEDLNYFRDMVREINQTQVLPEERLTDSIYLCDRGNLSLAVG